MQRHAQQRSNLPCHWSARFLLSSQHRQYPSKNTSWKVANQQSHMNETNSMTSCFTDFGWLERFCCPEFDHCYAPGGWQCAYILLICSRAMTATVTWTRLPVRLWPALFLPWLYHSLILSCTVTRLLLSHHDLSIASNKLGNPLLRNYQHPPQILN